MTGAEHLRSVRTERADERARDRTVPEPRRHADGRSRNVVILSATFPLPADGGNKVVLAGLVEYFTSRRGDGEVHYVFVGRPSAATRQAELGVPVHVVPPPGRWTRLASVARRSLFGAHGLQESLLWSTETRDELARVLAILDPDLVVADTVRMAQYLPALPDTERPYTVCHLDDLYSDRYRSMIDLQRDEPGIALRPLATFASFVPSRLRWLAEWGPTQRALLRFEANKVDQSERRAAADFDSVLLVNEKEAELLRERTDDDDTDIDVQSINPLSQTTGQARPLERMYRGGADYLTMGVLSAPHNDLAVRWLITDVMPLVRETVPDAHLRVLGKDPTPELLALAHADPWVELIGFVESLEPYLAGTCALLNPPWFASGVKLKVLDALASGTPVVSTTVGVDGVVDGPGQGVLVADSAEDFAAAMVALRDPDLNARVAADARRHHQRHYSRVEVFRQYDRVFSTFGAARGPERSSRDTG